MFCKNCGTWMPEDVPACFQCGKKNEYFMEESQRAEDAQSIIAEPKQNREEKKMVISLVVLTVFIAVFATIFVTQGGGTGGQREILFDGMMDDSRFLFFNAKGKTKEIEGTPSILYSGDKTRAVYVNFTDDMLYYIDSRLKPVKIKDKVLAVQFSLTGDRFVYLTCDDVNDCSLYIYDVKKKESSKISSDVYYNFFCLSPNGKVVAYVERYSNELYLYSNGKGSILVESDNCIPVAVSDDGKTFFYIKLRNQGGGDSFAYDLYYFDGKDDVQISEGIDGYQAFTNRSVSELLYSKDSQTYYFSIEQGEPKCVGKKLTMLAADSLPSISYFASIIFNLDTLTDAFYRDGDSVIWFGNDGLWSLNATFEEAAYAISEDGRTMLYLYDGSLYKVQEPSADAEAELLYEGLEATALITSEDLSHIYLITEHNNLYRYRDDGHMIQLSDWIQSEEDVAYNELDQKVYFLEDGELYCADAESDSKEMIAQDVLDLYVVDGGVNYSTGDDDISVYLVTKDGPVEVYQYSDKTF